jgi:hypothetical protein
MRNELLFGILAAVLILGMVSFAENVVAKKKPTYKTVIKINVNIPCVDEFYGRVSDSNINPLVGKFTTKNLKHTITKIEASFKFDPKKQVPSGFLSEYIILEINDQEVLKPQYGVSPQYYSTSIPFIADSIVLRVNQPFVAVYLVSAQVQLPEQIIKIQN